MRISDWSSDVCSSDLLPFLPVMTQAVLAARAHGLIVFDGVWNAIDDAEGFAAECAQGAAFGFDGKTLIHPGQIDICNRAYSPSADALATARAVVDAFADRKSTRLNSSH